MTTPSFSEFYSAAQFSEFRAHRALVIDHDAPDYAAHNKGRQRLLSVVRAAMECYLAARFEAGGLVAIEFNAGRRHPAASQWNRLVEKSDPDFQDGLAGLSNRICRGFVHSNFEANYEQLVAAVDAGNLQWFDLGWLTECQETGESIAIEMRNWAPILGHVDLSAGEFSPITAELPGPKVIHHVIQAPSGEILISD